MQLRLYQKQCIDAVFKALEHHSRVLAVLPTGSGKSLVCAALIEEFQGRVLILCHSREVLSQNLAEYCARGNEADVYCDALQKKHCAKDVVFATPQSFFGLEEPPGFTTVIVDECFTGETLITTNKGFKRIDEIIVGDKVLNQSGYGHVLAVSRRFTHELYKIEFDDKTFFECTGSHPIFTTTGWKPAREISCSDSVTTKETVQFMWENVLPNHSKEKKIHSSPDKGMVEATMLHSILCKEIEEPDVLGRFNRENEDFSFGESQNYKKRRKRALNAFASKKDIGSFRRWLAIRIGGADKTKAFRLSQLLQNRCGKQELDDSHRSGWQQPLCKDKKNPGQEKTKLPGISRVVSVSRVEQKSSRAVFNLHISGHPSYFASGKLVHNCHLVPARADSMYQTIFNRVGYKRLIGLTATPYRLDGGLMYGLNVPDPRLGKKRALPKSSKFFDICAYNLQLSDLIKWGFLSPYVVKTVDSPLVEGAELERSESTGEFTNTDDPRAWQANIAASVEYILEHTKDRKLTLIFCCGVRHAEHVAGIIRTYGHEAVSIDAKTPNRDALINNFKRDDSRYRYVVNCQTMTTGVNIPRIDCVVMARPTMSSSLFVQMAGRGLRLHPGKKDCLILDITDNTVNFGSLDDPMIFGTPTAKTLDLPLGLGEAAYKQCPKCKMDVPSATRACPHCNHIFIKPKEFYGDGQIHTIKLKPSGYHWKQQITKAGLPAIVLTMQTEAGRIDTWLNINHHNQWVARRGRAALTLLRSGKPLKWIKAYKNAKGYWEIMSYHTSDL